MSDFSEWITTLPPVLADRPHVVYIAWRDDMPLYVGMTSDLDRRLSAHRSSMSSGWTTGYTHIDFVEVPNRAAAERVEALVIADLQPGGNRWKPKPYLAEMSPEDLIAGDHEAARIIGETLFGRAS